MRLGVMLTGGSAGPRLMRLCRGWERRHWLDLQPPSARYGQEPDPLSSECCKPDLAVPARARYMCAAAVACV